MFMPSTLRILLVSSNDTSTLNTGSTAITRLAVRFPCPEPICSPNIALYLPFLDHVCVAILLSVSYDARASSDLRKAPGLLSHSHRRAPARGSKLIEMNVAVYHCRSNQAP